MGEIVFSVSRPSPLAPPQLWSLIVDGGGSVWPLLEFTGRLRVGSALRLQLPHPDGGSIGATGRVREIDPHGIVTIQQESPWDGTLRLQLRAVPTGTELRLTVRLSDQCLPWFFGEAFPARSGPSGRSGRMRSPRIGLIAPLSGNTGLMGRSVSNAATLAVEEIDATGDFSEPMTLMIADERADPLSAAAAFDRLTLIDRCDVIVTTVSSASMDLIAPLAAAKGTLLLSAALAERRPHMHNLLQFGEAPRDQLGQAIPQLMREADAHSWFLVGSDYIWPRTVGRTARAVITAAGGSIAGETYVPLNTHRFDELVERIGASGADLILSSVIGMDAVRFEQACFKAGIRAGHRTLATMLDQSVIEHVGDAAAEGIWSTQDYFSQPTSDLDGVGARYRQRFGAIAPPLTGMAKAVYESIHLYARAARLSTDPTDIERVLRSGRAGGARLLAHDAGRHLASSIVEVTREGLRDVSDSASSSE